MAGDVCGCLGSNGYLEAVINYVHYRLHRLAFLYMEGYLPEYSVDHKNGKRDDNRWCNLRHVSQRCNMQNCKASANNQSGFIGVSWDRSRNSWRTSAMVDHKSIYLGCHATALEAALARLTWEVRCSKWHCNSRGILVQQIQAAWPQFNTRSIQ